MFFQGLAVLFIDAKRRKHKDPIQPSDKNIVSLIKNYDDGRKNYDNYIKEDSAWSPIFVMKSGEYHSAVCFTLWNLFM